MDHLAVLTEVVRVWRHKNPYGRLGRTVMQKLLYFVKARGVKLPYEFELLHYGPYSGDAARDVQFLVELGVLEDRGQKGSGSDYTLSDQGVPSFKPLSEGERQLVDQVVRTFSTLSLTQMELVATVHYLHHALKRFWGSDPDPSTLIREVQRVKGDKFSVAEIQRAIEALKRAGIFTWDEGR